jgi:dTDP-glucose 4,6-dehydratase
MKKFERNILITGGAGFIGSHLVTHFVKKYPNYRIVNLDKLTYAGNLGNLLAVEDSTNYTFIKGDIVDLNTVRSVFKAFEIDGVLHCAAESHVDRSIEDPLVFVNTNLVGTATLLQVAKEQWKHAPEGKKFHHVSTDEVYGSLGEDGFFTETTSYDPQSPYSATKAGSDHLVRAFGHTYGIPVVLSNCSNNYGPYQFPEKLIPLFVKNAIESKPLPIYGKGINVRDWLHVSDHVLALDTVFHNGKNGETYNIGGHNEWRNIDLVHLLCDLIDKKLGRQEGTSRSRITYVQDRAGHDQRYAIDATKIKNELGWMPAYTFERGLSMTIDWYLDNRDWIHNVTSGSYQEYYSRQYASRFEGKLTHSITNNN